MIHPVLTQPAFYWHVLALSAGMKNPFKADPADLKHEGYHIWVDAKNGSDTHTGLWETVPVKTLMRAGEVLRLLPNDFRRALGVRIWLRGSKEGDPATYYRDYLEQDGPPMRVRTSPFQGQNNYWIATNPKDANPAILDGAGYDRSGATGLDAEDPYKPYFLYLRGDKITVKRLTFRNCAGDALRCRGDDAHFTGLTFYDNEACGLNVGGARPLIEFCYAHHNNSARLKGGVASSFKPQGTTDAVIRYCVAHNCAHTHFNLYDCTRALIYCCDAFEAGYHRDLSTRPYANSGGSNFWLGTAGPGGDGRDTIALCCRSWFALNSNYNTQRDGGVRLIYSTSYGGRSYGVRSQGFGSNLIANTISYDDNDQRIDSGDGGTKPTLRSNTWTLPLAVSSSSFSSLTPPRPAPEPGVLDNFLLPRASRFGDAGSFDAGFGRDVGPTRAVQDVVRALTPDEIRARVLAKSF